MVKVVVEESGVQFVCLDSGEGYDTFVCMLDDVPKIVADLEKARQLLGTLRDWAANDPRCGPQGLGMICEIDDLLNKEK